MSNNRAGLLTSARSHAFIPNTIHICISIVESININQNYPEPTNLVDLSERVDLSESFIPACIELAADIAKSWERVY